MPKPEPVPQTIVCSECGLDWALHEKPTLAECVRLLKAEVARRMQWTTTPFPQRQFGTANATVTTLPSPPREIPRQETG